MSFTEEDKLQRSEVVDKIKFLIDTLNKDSNFCLALDGEWGSGKSYVMEMIGEKLSNNNQYIVIKYDAWKNNFYPDPLIAILYCILDALPQEKVLNKYIRRINKEVKRLANEKIGQFVEERIDSIVEGLYKLGGWAIVCAFSIEVIKKVIVHAKSSILDNKLFDNFKSYQSLLKDVMTVLNSLTTKQRDNTNVKLVVLVDEVDRCLPNEQLIVLERLHHLFEVKNCVVIVSLNKSSVARTYKSLFSNDGEEYLRKFFDFTCVVDTRIYKFLDYFINKDLFERLTKLQWFQNDTTLFYLQIANKILYDYLFNIGVQKKLDNRTIERFYSSLLRIFDLYGWEKLNIKYIFTTIICLFIVRFVDAFVLQPSKNSINKNFIIETLLRYE